MELHLTWQVKTGQYQTGETLFINGFPIADYHWNGSRNRDIPADDAYVGNLLLPCVSDKSWKSVYSDNTNIIKRKLETLAKNWFEKALK